MTIANGQSEASFRYKSTTLGVHALTATHSTGVLTAASQNLTVERTRVIVQTFYLPIPEDQSLQAHSTINAAAVTPVINRISLAILTTGTVIHYDQYENGYEADLNAPLSIYNASTNPGGTQIWGDGDASNGAPPGYPGDVMAAGNVIVLSASVPVPIPDPASNFYFGGRDKIGATKSISVVRAVWATGSNTLMADANEVFDTTNWGTDYRAPVGTSIPDATDFQMFEYSSFMIMAGRAGATIQIDLDGNGTAESSVTLTEGQSHVITSGVNPGSRITSDKPIQVELVTGDIGSNYESRFFKLLPFDLWSGRYVNPVSTPTTAQGQTGTDTTVWLYNPAATAITVNYQTRNTSGVLTTTSLSVPGGTAGGYLKQVVPVGYGSSFTSVGGAKFYACSTTDSNSGNTDGTGNQAWDWGFTLVPETSLLPQVLVGLGIGRDPTSGTNPTENGNPVWVTPLGNTDTAATIYIDFDANPTTGALTDPNGNKYDTSLSLKELEQGKVYNPAGDQTGMLLYTLTTGVKLAAAWGQDPLVASAAAPGLDLGTGIPPLPLFTATKVSAMESDNDADGFLSPGDELFYTIYISNNSRAPVTDFTLKDTLPPGTVYVPNSTVFINNSNVSTAIADDASGTAFPLDGAGKILPETTLPVGGTWKVTFRTLINPFSSLPANLSEILNQGNATALNETVPFETIDPIYGRIGDFVWNDGNGNGLQDPGETGVPGLTVRLYDGASNLLATTTTDSSGKYKFTGLLAGNYQVGFTLPTGYQYSTQNSDGLGVNGPANSDANVSTGRTVVFALAAGEPKLTLDAGMSCSPPTIVCPTNKTVECSASTDPSSTGTATGVSPCGCPVTITYSDATATTCGNARVITRTWTATDECSHSVSCIQTITVVDTTKPVLVGVPANTTVQCDAVPAAPTVTATDTCDTSVIPVLTTSTTPGACAQSYTLTRTWTATDDCGNVQTAAQVITVQDTTAPVFSGVGGPATIQCDQPVVFSSPAITDNCDATPTLTFADATVPGSCPQNFVRTRT
ncbi:MAG: SdrD B-like domain-containing protein, partial [Kiritimatiellia bacterium]